MILTAAFGMNCLGEEFAQALTVTREERTHSGNRISRRFLFPRGRMSEGSGDVYNLKRMEILSMVKNSGLGLHFFKDVKI